MNYEITKNESDVIFIMKSIGIIAVVVGHYPGVLFEISHAYYYHMPLFFFIAGIFIKDKINYKKLICNTIKIIKYIFITYVIIGVLSIYISREYSIYLGDPFLDNIYNTLKHTYERNFHNNPLFLVSWFLLAYSIAIIFSSLVISAINNLSSKTAKVILTILSVVFIGYLSVNFFAIKYLDTKNQIFNLISQVLFATVFMILGNKTWTLIMRYKFNLAIITLMSVIVFLYDLFVKKTHRMAWSEYPAGLLLSMVISFSCICLIVTISTLISLTKLSELAKSFGIYSREIMSYHLIVFILLDILMYKLGYWDISKSATFKHYFSSASQYFYPFLAIITPVITCISLNKIKNLIIKKLAFSQP